MSADRDRFDPLGFARRILIVAVLSLGMVLLHQYATPGQGLDPRAMLSLGFLILAAYTIGELATTVGIPHITGYLLSGVLFGPSLAELLRTHAPHLRLPPPLDEGIVSRGVLGQLGPVDAFALALIALSAGGELELDELKRSLRYVVGSTLGMVTATIGGVFVFLVSLVAVAPALLPTFAAQSTAATLVLCLIVGTLAAATSPAVSIAVVHSTGAKGPVASTVLTGVVVGEIVLVVLFSAITSIALPILGGVGAVSVGESVARVAGSAGVGLLSGVAIATYLRVVSVDLLLFLAGAIYATTWIVVSFGGEPAVAFIAAGLVVGNAHRAVPAAGPDVGRTLLASVERVSRPVFAVFFALAGAKLHLDVFATLAVPALAIFAVRAVTVRFGTTAGARLSGAPAVVEQYAWTGFVSQAGLAIALASQARSVLPDSVRDAVYSLAIAIIAVAEIVGPSVLQHGLRAAGEIPTGNGAAGASTAPPAEQEGPHAWPAPDHAPWPLRPPLDDPELDAALAVLDAELEQLVESEVAAPMEGLRRDTESFVRVLRQQWTRQFRPSRWSRLRDQELATELRASLGTAIEASIELLRGFDPVAGTDRSPFVPGPLVERVDRLVGALPAIRPAPVPATFLAPRPEPTGSRLRRALLRAGVRWFGARRTVSLRDLGRYHLSGAVPASLEPVLAILPHARCHVADRLSEVFTGLARVVATRAADADAGQPTEQVLTDLGSDLRTLDDRFSTLLEELAAVADDGTERARAAFAALASALYEDAERAGTFSLGSRGPRYAPRFRERSRTAPRLAAAGDQGRILIRSRYDELLLELEVLALRVRADAVTAREAALLDARFGRHVVAGLRQVDADLERWLGFAGDAIDSSATHEELGQRLSEAWTKVRADVQASLAGLRTLSDHLASQAWADPLIAALNRGLDGLSAAHLLGVRRAPADRRSLPPAPAVRSVPTAKRAAALVESRIVQPLRAFGQDVAGEVTEALAAAVEVERVAQFNVDLALAELELAPPASAPTPERREQLRSMLIAAPTRTRQRLRQRLDQLVGRDGTLGRDLVACVQAASGLDAELRSGAFTAPTDRGWLRALPTRLGDVTERVRAGLGEERLLALRRSIGLQVEVPAAELVSALRPPPSRIAIPQVYARLFSDLPFEAGDLVAGRHAELAAVRAALETGLRSAAVVGIDPHGARALVTEALGSGRSPLWFDADGPAEPGTVARWLDGRADGRGQVFVIENLRWLFRRRPGGFAEIEALAERILRDGGRNQWLLLADGGVWRYLQSATALRDVMGASVELDPMTAEELERAITSRHAMSGYDLVFEPGDDLVYKAWRAWARGTEAERSRAAWFRTLHDASGGVLQDAMRLWLAAVRAVDDDGEHVVLGPVPRPPFAHLATLDDTTLLTLLETRRQGWIDAEELRLLFRTRPGAAEAHLAQLRHLGVLVPHGTVSKLAPHLRGPIERVLGERGWT